MTCLKKGLLKLVLNRPWPLNMEVKSALPLPHLRLFLSFFFTCYTLFLLDVAVTFGQDCLWTLCLRFTLVFFKICIVSTKKISLAYCPLGYFNVSRQ